jgi:hypothetical protein
VDSVTNKKVWYKGCVLGVLSGRDGDIDCVYEVQYDGEGEPCEVDHLVQDYLSLSVKFCDV